MNEIEQIKEILNRYGLQPNERVKEIRRALGVSALKPGRKKEHSDRKKYSREYNQQRRARLLCQGKCVQCGKKNDRLPRTQCLACAAKNSPIVRRKLMKQRLETP